MYEKLTVKKSLTVHKKIAEYMLRERDTFIDLCPRLLLNRLILFYMIGLRDMSSLIFFSSSSSSHIHT